MKLKMDDAGHVVVSDGKPVYVHDDGKEVAFDAPATIAKIGQLNGEAKGHRERAELAEGKLKAFEGIEDAAAAKKALETVANLDQGQLVTAGKVEEIKAAAKKAAEEQVAAAAKASNEKIAELTKDRDGLQSALFTEKVGGAFSRSKFISEKIAVPSDMLQAMFGSRFKVENGKIIGIGADNQPIYSRSKAGEIADFDEALESMVDGYAQRDHILNSTVKCRVTAGTGDPEDCSASQVRSVAGLVIGTDVQAHDSDLAALAGNSSNGLWARTGTGTGAARTVTGTANEIAVSNGDGVSGNPTMTIGLHPRCNIDWPCSGPLANFKPQTKNDVAGKLSGGTSARIARADRFRNVEFGAPMYPPETARSFLQRGATILPHPAGCPSRAFCGCGAAVEVFGRPIRSLWLAANWLAFPRTSPAPGMVAARRGHVFVIKQVLGGGNVLAYDANSGGRRTRLHVRSLAGFVVVNPHG